MKKQILSLLLLCTVQHTRPMFQSIKNAILNNHRIQAVYQHPYTQTYINKFLMNPKFMIAKGTLEVTSYYIWYKIYELYTQKACVETEKKQLELEIQQQLGHNQEQHAQAQKEKLELEYENKQVSIKLEQLRQNHVAMTSSLATAAILGSTFAAYQYFKRPSIQEIYHQATNTDEAIQLFKKHGYTKIDIAHATTHKFSKQQIQAITQQLT